MKLHIVFELDCLPDTSLGDIAAMMPLAASAFERACAPLGDCRLHRTQSHAIMQNLTLDSMIEREVTRSEPPEPIETPLPPARGVG